MTAERIALWLGFVAMLLIAWWLVDWVANDATPAVHDLVK